MASACLNTIGLSPENLPECSQKYSSYRWLSSRLSITGEMHKKKSISPTKNVTEPPEVADPATEITDPPEFEFRLEDSATMLPADELFSDGKLLPLQFTSTTTVSSSGGDYRRRIDNIGDIGDTVAGDPYMYSPKAPRCSSRWKELLGFKKLHQTVQTNTTTTKSASNTKQTSSSSFQTTTGASRSIRHLLHRKSFSDSPINVPLLTGDTESATISSRPSLSSSSSDDLPRLSLDSDHPTTRRRTRMSKTTTNTTTTRVGRSSLRRSSDTQLITTHRGFSVDSPRINSSGKIIFHSLERSSSSPSTLIGGPKHRGIERSYSGNVRITPVLNVPVCSLRSSSKSGGVFGFPMFSSQQKREASSTCNNGGSNRSQRVNGRS